MLEYEVFKNPTLAVEAVVNGTKVEPGDAPYVVQVLVNQEHVCGGFIYSEYWVVTAASCVYGYASAKVKRKELFYYLVQLEKLPVR